MTKGTIDGKSELAGAAKQGTGNTPKGTRQLGDRAGDEKSGQGTSPASKSGSRLPGKPGDVHDDAGAEGKPRAKKIILKIPGVDIDPEEADPVRSKRLSAASVRRLRMSVGDLLVKHKANTKQPPQPSVALTSYDFGYQSGYAAGENDQKELKRLQEQADEGVTPRNLRIWQASTIFLLGVLVGLVF